METDILSHSYRPMNNHQYHTRLTIRPYALS
jgi:hypothetical protein